MEVLVFLNHKIGDFCFDKLIEGDNLILQIIFRMKVDSWLIVFLAQKQYIIFLQ